MENKKPIEETRFEVSMNLLVDAVDNVIWNSEYTGMSEILIDYLRETADNIEQVCIEEFGEDWREDNEVHNDLINNEIKVKC